MPPWLKYLLILLPCLGACLVIYLYFDLTSPVPPQSHRADYIGNWKEFNDHGYIAQVDADKMLIQGKDGQVLTRKPGRWIDGDFYCPSPDGPSGQVLAAHRLPNEDLQVWLQYFVPGETRVLTMTLESRGPFELHPYPTEDTPGIVATYPPPKGLFRIGMLEADMQFLPWHPVAVEYHETPGVETDEFGPGTYRYRSDNPARPDLLVVVQRGRVISVSGGAESTDDPPYVFPPPSRPPRDKSESGGLVSFLLDLLFKK